MHHPIQMKPADSEKSNGRCWSTVSSNTVYFSEEVRVGGKEQPGPVAFSWEGRAICSQLHRPHSAAWESLGDITRCGFRVRLFGTCSVWWPRGLGSGLLPPAEQHSTPDGEAGPSTVQRSWGKRGCPQRSRLAFFSLQFLPLWPGNWLTVLFSKLSWCICIPVHSEFILLIK